MKEFVIDQPPKLDSREKRIADLHSVFNILNVLCGELSLISSLPDMADKGDFETLQHELESIGEDIRESENVAHTLGRIRASEYAIFQMTDQLLEQAGDSSIRDEMDESISNMKSVYRIVHRRIDEFEARAENPDLWIEMRSRDFERQFREVFYAIEKNAKGRYRISFNLARKQAGDYYIDLKIESELHSEMLWIPLRLIDVLRDLTANARKYTLPGGKVALAIYQTKKDIQVLVEDSGFGIPEDELDRVVEFGYRASNVRDRPTMGGGFGLTKAAWLVHQWGGTMRIQSGEGEGTTVRISIPNRLNSDGAVGASNFNI